MLPKKTKAIEAKVVTLDDGKVEVTASQRQAKIEALKKQYEKFSIATQTEYSASVAVLQDVKTIMKEQEDDRLFFVEDITKYVSKVNARYKPQMDCLKFIEAKIKSAQVSFIITERRKQEEEQRRIEEQQRKQQAEESKDVDQQICDAMAEGDTDKAQDLLSQKEQAQTFVPAPTAAVAPVIPKIAGQKVIDIWKVVVVDFSKLPDRYKIANMDALQGIADATEGKEVIEGVRFEKDVRIASSAR
jgi:hypothetical protein